VSGEVKEDKRMEERSIFKKRGKKSKLDTFLISHRQSSWMDKSKKKCGGVCGNKSYDAHLSRTGPFGQKVWAEARRRSQTPGRYTGNWRWGAVDMEIGCRVFLRQPAAGMHWSRTGVERLLRA
jgi:hypothetical protein